MNETEKHVEAVREKLLKLEKEHGCKVLYAAVMGSRAYGLDNIYSDCDTHFVFVYPAERYLNLEEPPHFLNAGDDVNGWELRFFLNMVKKSAYSVHEMLGSPLCVMGQENHEELSKLALEFYSPVKLVMAFCGYVQREITKFCKFDYHTPTFFDYEGLVKCALSMSRLYMTADVLGENYYLDEPYPKVNFFELMDQFSFANDVEETEKFKEALKTLADYKKRGIPAGEHDKAVELCAYVCTLVPTKMKALHDIFSKTKAPLTGDMTLLNNYFRKQVGL